MSTTRPDQQRAGPLLSGKLARDPDPLVDRRVHELFQHHDLLLFPTPGRMTAIDYDSHMTGSCQ